MRSKLEKKIAEAMDHAKISKYEKDILNARLTKIIFRTCMMMGNQSPNESFVAVLASDMADVLMENFQTFTVHEVYLAFTMGTQGAFGNYGYYAANMGTFISWLKSYRCCEQRKAVLDSMEKNTAKTDFKPYSRILRGLTEAEYAEGVFMSYRAGIDLENFSPCLAYDFFEKMGRINDSPEVKQAAFELFQEVTVMGVVFTGEAQRNIAAVRAKRYLLEKHFDEWIAEEKLFDEADDFAA